MINKRRRKMDIDETKKEVDEETEYKKKVEAMLLIRGIKKRVPMLVWLRSQKQLAVDANMRRAYKVQWQMHVLEEMIEGEPESIDTTGRGDVT
jgi:hypothetical protein